MMSTPWAWSATPANWESWAKGTMLNSLLVSATHGTVRKCNCKRDFRYNVFSRTHILVDFCSKAGAQLCANAAVKP